jgi:hypothetical protein
MSHLWIERDGEDSDEENKAQDDDEDKQGWQQVQHNLEIVIEEPATDRPTDRQSDRPTDLPRDLPPDRSPYSLPTDLQIEGKCDQNILDAETCEVPVPHLRHVIIEPRLSHNRLKATHKTLKSPKTSPKTRHPGVHFFARSLVALHTSVFGTRFTREDEDRIHYYSSRYLRVSYAEDRQLLNTFLYCAFTDVRSGRTRRSFRDEPPETHYSRLVPTRELAAEFHLVRAQFPTSWERLLRRARELWLSVLRLLDS